MSVAKRMSGIVWHPRARCASRLGVVAWLTVVQGCHTWRRAELEPTPVSAAGQRVRVVRRDGSTTVLAGAHVIGDSLVGTQQKSSSRVAMPVTDIRRAERYELNGTRTTLLVVGVLAALYLAIGAIAVSQMQFDLGLQL